MFQVEICSQQLFYQDSIQLVHKKYHNECHALDKDTRKQMVNSKSDQCFC
jgi:hypothetical protein